MSVLTTAGLAGFFAVSGGATSAESSAAIVATPTAAAPRALGGGAVPANPTPAAPTATAPTTTQPTVVDGGVFHNKWGDVQVEATFVGGQLVDVTALRSPDDRGQSVRINDVALPRLTTEALSAQTAAVHTVSGATYTSDGYRKSLQSAIDVARAAGVTAIS